MPTLLRYGVDRSVEIRPADEGSLIDCASPKVESLPDVAAAVAAALAGPLNYPPLALGTTPGDRIVLAIEAGVPQSGAISAAVIDYLVRNGVELDGIKVLCAPTEGPDPIVALQRDWPAAWKDQVKVLVHDPADARQLVYLARDSLGESVFLNRALTDADVVLPIGTLFDDRAAGYFGVHAGLFPTFSSHKALEPFRVLAAFRERGKHRSQLLAEVEQVAWLLGIAFTIQIVPGGGERVLQVLAGEPAAVRDQGRALYRTAWDGSVDQRAALVVAGIEGGPGQQTWLSFARALATAIPLVEEGGAIALCCELNTAPGPALQSLCDADSPQDTLLRIRKRRFPDFLPAALLVRALESNQVFLMSGLDSVLVEQLSMVPLGGADELARLVSRHQSCIVLANAPQAAVKLREES
jgi:nickel-dependent lactate racemase